MTKRKLVTNLDLPPGIHRTKAGHLRYSRPKELRGKYVHRVVVERLIDEMPYSIKLLLPWPYEVHHADYDKENNQPGNLIIVSEAFHSAMTADRKRAWNGTFKPKWSKPPEWLPLLDEGQDEVPF